ncbi:hypothetical protein B0H16DRAFT_712637 [Mycena metata]|uniref:Transmembrane protein n=1 Tax=Mycena metata TaxID=1033252 RepID=A0AAD7M7J3_9AGAR|nr:hypothetical protein B0H16DRAFT_712637 [Mycena metata]
MPTAYILSFVAFVLSFVAHVHATVSTTAPISFPCAAYQPSTERGVTHSHPRFMAVGVLSLMFVVSAHALRRAVSASSPIPLIGTATLAGGAQSTGVVPQPGGPSGVATQKNPVVQVPSAATTATTERHRQEEYMTKTKTKTRHPKASGTAAKGNKSSKKQE